MEYFWAANWEILNVSGGRKPFGRKEIYLLMHNFLVAAAFLLMVILPCIVTMGSGSSEDGEEA